MFSFRLVFRYLFVLCVSPFRLVERVGILCFGRKDMKNIVWFKEFWGKFCGGDRGEVIISCVFLTSLPSLSTLSLQQSEGRKKYEKNFRCARYCLSGSSAERGVAGDCQRSETDIRLLTGLRPLPLFMETPQIGTCQT